jgi:hypothetical protein
LFINPQEPATARNAAESEKCEGVLRGRENRGFV